MSRLEAVVALAGGLLIALSVALFDPRLGLGVLGAVLVATSVDLRGTRK